MRNQLYPTDLSDSQWHVIEELLPKEKPGGRRRSLDMRRVVNAIFYVVVGGIKWRMLPRDYPKWKSVYHYFRQWRISGDWRRIHESARRSGCSLRARLRRQSGRHKQPTAGCLDSQSVKTTEIAGVRGYDGAKRLKGRKRHVLVDSLGLLLLVVVTAASLQDRDGARLLLGRLSGSCKKLRLIWVDGGYRGELLTWVAERFRFRLKVVLRPEEAKGFMLLPRRWVVERTLGWLNQYRRLSKDYEVLPESSEAMIYLAMTRLMLRRIKPS